MTPDQVYELVYATATVFLAIILIVIIKAMSNLPISLLGPELNLLTYGYLLDTGIAALKGEPYWVNIWGPLIPIKGLLLLMIAIGNALLTFANIKLVDRIENGKLQLVNKRANKGLSVFLGVISLFVFLTFKTFWK